MGTEQRMSKSFILLFIFWLIYLDYLYLTFLSEKAEYSRQHESDAHLFRTIGQSVAGVDMCFQSTEEHTL